MGRPSGSHRLIPLSLALLTSIGLLRLSLGPTPPPLSCQAAPEPRPPFRLTAQPLPASPPQGIGLRPALVLASWDFSRGDEGFRTFAPLHTLEDSRPETLDDAHTGPLTPPAPPTQPTISPPSGRAKQPSRPRATAEGLQLPGLPQLLASPPGLDLPPDGVREAVLTLQTSHPARLLLTLTPPGEQPLPRRLYRGAWLEPSPLPVEVTVPLDFPAELEDGLRLDRLWLTVDAPPDAQVRLASASLRTASRQYEKRTAGVTLEGLGGHYQRTLFQHGPAPLFLRPPTPGRLDFSVGLLTPGAQGRFFLSRGTPGHPEAEELLWSGQGMGGHWTRARAELPAFKPDENLILRVDTPPGEPGLWGAPEARSSPSHQPSVLLYLVDCLRADALDLNTATTTTPNLAAFARQAVVFTQAWAPSSWTLPSLPSLLTGLPPSQSGVRQAGDRLAPQAQPLAEWLHLAGYRTAAMSASPFAGRLLGLERGLDELWEADGVGPTDLTGGSARRLNGLAVPWLKASPSPFFLYIHTVDPHFPYRPPWLEIPAAPELQAPGHGGVVKPTSNPGSPDALLPSIPTAPIAGTPSDSTLASLRAFQNQWEAFRQARARAGIPLLQNFLSADAFAQPPRAAFSPQAYATQARQLYQGAVQGNDAAFGQLMAALKAQGLDNDTVVIVLADHGESFLEHGVAGHGGPLEEALLHVPLLIRWPASLPPRRVDEPVSLLEVLPTLADLLHLPAPPGVSGRSLAPALLGRPLPPALLRAEAWPSPHPASRAEIALRDGQFKLRVWRDSGVEKAALFDLRADPLEQTDLAASLPHVLTRLRQQVPAEWAREATQHAPRGLESASLDRLRALGYVGE